MSERDCVPERKYGKNLYISKGELKKVDCEGIWITGRSVINLGEADRSQESSSLIMIIQGPNIAILTLLISLLESLGMLQSCMPPCMKMGKSGTCMQMQIGTMPVV